MIFLVYYYEVDFTVDYYRVFADNAQAAIEKILSLDLYAIVAELVN